MISGIKQNSLLFEERAKHNGHVRKAANNRPAGQSVVRLVG